jgi:hypothetical protein
MQQVADKINELLDHGLCKGLGQPVPGQMCVEAVVCHALGLPHGDEPTCVGLGVRAFKIRLNDAEWSSNKARADGMRKIAVAQLGSDQLDQKVFTEKLAFKTITVLLAQLFDELKIENNLSQCKDLAEAAGAAWATGAARAAGDAAWAAEAARAAGGDKYLILAADLCLEVLTEMESPGCSYL